MDELINFKIRKHFAMKRFIEKNPEPSSSENCVLVVVYHMNLGRIEMFFSNNDTFETVYCWIGSLQINPEYFVLDLDRPYCVLKLNESVLKAKRRLVMMSVCELAQFHFPHLENDLNESSSTPLINCPVCEKKQEASETETNAARCADDKYIVVFDSESEKSNVSEFPAETIEHKTFAQSENEIFDKIKEIVNDLSSHIDCKPISVKIRRNNVFEDFCTRFKQKWVLKNLGAKLKGCCTFIFLHFLCLSHLMFCLKLNKTSRGHISVSLILYYSALV